ncbi:unnamed protein product [Dovyalis caffra]|uniref:Uncharacterized protein n=1 Tax=Dovyalis caffra TaxID=77055 RepID=A0AAV1QW91_9ROSI|nr:unnamed protein product [Dovyalis caffra]
MVGVTGKGTKKEISNQRSHKCEAGDNQHGQGNICPIQNLLYNGPQNDPMHLMAFWSGKKRNNTVRTSA